MTTEPGDVAKAPRWRWWLWIAAALLLGVQLWTDQSEAGYRIMALLGLIALLVVLVFSVQYVEQRTRRPRKTYLRCALAAGVLALAFVVMPLAIGAGIVIGLILWAGFSAAMLAWAIYYERTEPV